MEEFQQFLRERLAARGWKFIDLGRAAGLNSSIIGRWFGPEAKQPSPMSLMKIAPHIGGTYEDLMRMVGHMPADDAEPDANRVDDELERNVLVFRRALQDVPRVFWPAYLDANLKMADAMKGLPEAPINTPVEPPVKRPVARLDAPHDGEDPGLILLSRALAA